jgi:hypothetical protein
MHQLILLRDPNNSNPRGTVAYLIRFCNHELEQADQCVLIAQNVGKCILKTGEYAEIKEMYDNLKLIEVSVIMGKVKTPQ